MDFKYIFMFFWLALLSGWGGRKSAMGMIVKLGIRSPYYPRHYIVLRNGTKRFLHIRQRVIPKYLYVELLLSLFFLGLGPMNTLIYIAMDASPKAACALMLAHCGLVIVDTVYFLIMSLFFRKKQRKSQN